MPDVHLVRQHRYFDKFRCIGADCEDSCCQGWGIPVDIQTWEKYRKSGGFRIAGKALSDLVEINPASTSPIDYARMRLNGAACPAFSEGLCSIQAALGESYIPDLCSTYPRVLNLTGRTVEKSLHLSCPEAARLVLGDPDAMGLIERVEELQPYRAGSVSLVAGAEEGIDQVRALMIDVIKERSIPVWQRILFLGFAIERIGGMEPSHAVGIMRGQTGALRQGLYQDIFIGQKAAPALQLETVLELVVARIGADYTSPRFLDCYSQFMRGLAWTKESTMEELAARYSQAFKDHFQPFLRNHEHLLENYLINYVFRTLFPYRHRQPARTYAIDSSKESMQGALLLLATHYAIVRTMLIGMAALHKSDLNLGHALKLVQSYAKGFLHDNSFEALIIGLLGKNFRHTTQAVAALVIL